MPYFGICYGFQWAVTEYARGVCGLAGANSTEVDDNAQHKVIYKLQDLLGVDAFTAGAWYVAIDFQLFALLAGLHWLSSQGTRGPEASRRFTLICLAVTALSLFWLNLDPDQDFWAPYFFAAYGLGVLAERISRMERKGPALTALALLAGAALLVDWRSRILVAAVVALGIGYYVPLPVIDQAKMAEFMSASREGIFGQALSFVSMFSGGTMSQAVIFTWGVMPYISASIIFQLLASVYPPLEKLQKEGESGRKKINEYTRYATVFIALLQSTFLVQWLMRPEASGGAGLAIGL